MKPNFRKKKPLKPKKSELPPSFQDIQTWSKNNFVGRKNGIDSKDNIVSWRPRLEKSVVKKKL